MKKAVFLLLLTIFSVLPVFSQVQLKEKPNWVTSEEYNKTPSIKDEEISQGLLTLLYEEQINTDSQEVYYKIASKVTENVGTQPASNISVTFDPTYQRLSFHTINIIREGKKINKLFPNSFQTMRRELSAENYIYDGSLSAVTNLSDVRMGDIIEYSYSVKGFNPINKNHFSSTINLRTSNPVGKLLIKILSKEKLFFKYFETNIKVKETTVNDKNIYTFKEENINAYKYEDQTPVWKIESGILNVSNYKTWKEVVDWGVKVYDYNNNLSSELSNKIDEIKRTNKTDGERIKACLNFVQNDVRYLGLESGIGAYKPNSPNKVFKQLFGDCKDKSILLVAMLKAMNIKAYPVLVSTYLKGTIKKFLPSPHQFNHCITKVVTNDGGEYWYDPTISNQGGTYSTTPFPDYRYGLVLKKGNNDLEEIFPFNLNSVEITDNFILEETGKGATLTIKSIYKEGEADNMRTFFKNNSISSIKKEYENYYSRYFNNIKSLKNPEFSDDIDNNIFTINEEYKIDSLWKPSVIDNHIAVEFYPYSIIDILTLPNKLERKEPFAMVFPATRNHVINVKLPHQWTIDQRGFTINSPNLYYDFEIAYLPKDLLLTLNHSVKIQKDHVSVDEFPKFYENMKMLDTRIGYSLVIPKDSSNISSSTSFYSSNFSLLKIVGILIFWGALFTFIWFAIKLYKYDPKPKIESYYEENKAIGGWLILIGIGICLSPFRILFDLVEQNFFLSGEWLTYFSSENNHFSLPIGILFFFEVIINAALVVITPLLIILFFKKRSSFPKIYAIVLISSFVFAILDYLVASNNNNLPFVNRAYQNRLLLTFISTSIITFYLLLSERVKETFIQRLNK